MSLWFQLKLAYKNLWFKRRGGVLAIFGLYMFVNIVSGLFDVYKKVGYVGVVICACLSVFIVFFVFPLVILFVECHRDPDYINRLLTTFPEYYNGGLRIKNTDR